jgi:hypothetical protein
VHPTAAAPLAQGRTRRDCLLPAGTVCPKHALWRLHGRRLRHRCHENGVTFVTELNGRTTYSKGDTVCFTYIELVLGRR